MNKMNKVRVIYHEIDEYGNSVGKIYHKPKYSSHFNKLSVVQDGYWEVVEPDLLHEWIYNRLLLSEKISWSDEGIELIKNIIKGEQS